MYGNIINTRMSNGVALCIFSLFLNFYISLSSTNRFQALIFALDMGFSSCVFLPLPSDLGIVQLQITTLMIINVRFPLDTATKFVYVLLTYVTGLNYLHMCTDIIFF